MKIYLVDDDLLLVVGKYNRQPLCVLNTENDYDVLNMCYDIRFNYKELLDIEKTLKIQLAIEKKDYEFFYISHIKLPDIVCI